MTKARPAQARTRRPRAGGAGLRRPRPAARPFPRGDSLYTPRAGSTRRSLEHSSARPLAFLHQLPGWVTPVALLALLVTGFAVPGWIGAVALVAVAGFLGWLAYVSWPALHGRGRLLRVTALAVVLALAVIQARR